MLSFGLFAGTGSRRDGFHVECTHERATAHLFIDEVVRVAAAHEGHEEHRVETGNHLRGATREKNHGQVHVGLEGSHLLGEREVTEVRTAHQEEVGTVLRGHRTRLRECGLVRSIGIEQHRKKGTALFDFSIQAEFGLTWFHNKILRSQAEHVI